MQAAFRNQYCRKDGNNLFSGFDPGCFHSWNLYSFSLLIKSMFFNLKPSLPGEGFREGRLPDSGLTPSDTPLPGERGKDLIAIC
jgi:hypothetical protein